MAEGDDHDPAEEEAQQDHHPRLLGAEGEPGAGDGERVGQRGGEEVGGGGGQGDALAQEAQHDGEGAALADREDEPGEEPGDHAAARPEAEQPAQPGLGQEEVDQRRAEGAEEQERDALEQQGREGEEEVGEGEPGAQAWRLASLTGGERQYAPAGASAAGPAPP